MMPAGSINAWKCPTCRGLTVAVHVDQGVTPMFLACRATPRCQGRAVSAGYPSAPIPPSILAAVGFEWRAASMTELKRYRRENPPMYEHCRAGGLVIDMLSDRGRALLPAGSAAS